MRGYSVTMLADRVQAGEVDALFLPRTPRKGKRGVVLLHGRGATTLPYIRQAQCFLDSTNLMSGVKMATYLASNGIPCIAGQFADNPWANDTHMARITAAWNVLIANGCASDKVCLYGVSMGGGAAARYAMTNPTKVAAGYGTAPVSSIVNMYANNIGSWQTEIAGQWGVTAPASLPSGADLLAQAHLASAIPWRLDYGTADTIINPADVTALAAAWGAKCAATVIDTTNDHGELIFTKTAPSAVLAHFVANGA